MQQMEHLMIIKLATVSANLPNPNPILIESCDNNCNNKVEIFVRVIII